MSKLDAQRFDELVLFIAHETKDDRRFGRVKLAKVLYYSDFDAYRNTERSLTGATYVHKPFGPFPRALDGAELRLASAQRVRLERGAGQGEEKRLIPMAPSNADALFESWQLGLVRSWIERISQDSTKKVSDDSHELPSWRLTEEEAEIPYALALLPQERPSGQEAKEAEDLARERGWLTEGQWIWEREPT
jgi:hypothetical protein